MNLMILNRLTYTILLILPIFLFVSTYSDIYNVPSFGGDVSTVFVPRVYLVLWIVLSFLAFFTSRNSLGESTEASSMDTFSFTKLLLSTIISVATAFAMVSFGFILATIPGFFLFCWTFGYRKLWVLIIISIVAPLALWFIFNNFLQLPLPRSPWFRYF